MGAVACHSKRDFLLTGCLFQFVFQISLESLLMDPEGEHGQLCDIDQGILRKCAEREHGLAERAHSPTAGGHHEWMVRDFLYTAD